MYCSVVQKNRAIRTTIARLKSLSSSTVCAVCLVLISGRVSKSKQLMIIFRINYCLVIISFSCLIVKRQKMAIFAC